MNNFEFYKERFDTTDFGMVKGEPIGCCDVSCETCDWCHLDCNVSRWEWLKAEYVEPPVDWSAVEVDTPILVSNNEDSWVRRYFARFEKGKVCAWSMGVTSWTADNDYDITGWNYAKLAEDK